ncbi:MAG: hypothetical protein ACYC4L_17955 [Chloroflexota bacterium]
MGTIALRTFFTDYVDGYLFEDLRSMHEFTLPPERKTGGLGYTMLLTILAGMELLGYLLYNKTYTPRPDLGATHFEEYWTRYLSHEVDKYGDREVAMIVRSSLRNGIAHVFLAKPGIEVKRGDPRRHMTRGSESGRFIIDPDSLFEDFKRSYNSRVRPIVFDGTRNEWTSSDQMQEQLNAVIDTYSNEVKKKAAIFDRFPVSTIQATTSGSFTAVQTTSTSLPRHRGGGTISPGDALSR